MEGYLSLLVGQDVPYERTYHPDPHDAKMWQHIQETIRQRVTALGMTVPDALRAVRAPGWSWPDMPIRLKQPIMRS